MRTCAGTACGVPSACSIAFAFTFAFCGANFDALRCRRFEINRDHTMHAVFSRDSLLFPWDRDELLDELFASMVVVSLGS